MKIFFALLFLIGVVWLVFTTIGGELLALRLVEARASLAQAEAGRLAAAADLAQAKAFQTVAETNQSQSAALSTLALLAIGWALVLSLLCVGAVVLAMRGGRQRYELPPARIVYLPSPVQEPMPEAWPVERLARRQEVNHE